MKNRTRIAGITLAAIAAMGAALGGLVTGSGPASASITIAAHSAPMHMATVTSTCANYTFWQRTSTGHEADFPMSICGVGVPAGSWYCPMPASGLVPGVKITGCTKIG